MPKNDDDDVDIHSVPMPTAQQKIPHQQNPNVCLLLRTHIN